LVDIWKKNILEDLEAGVLEYETAVKLLADIKKKFGGKEKEIVKVAKLKQLEQGRKMIKKFLQEFK